ncbi:MAG: FG-GAP repeat protein, partial [Gammaproteobacteria bacterium]|nr:FG-GAP repeat protein [Gammaproteobacteria bacterium]
MSAIPASALPVVLETISQHATAYHIHDDFNRAGKNNSYSARHPEKGLDYRFSNDGIRINALQAVPIQLHVKAYGFGGAIQPVSPTTAPVVSGARIDYQYDDLSEWFINSPLGLEHGFTLQAPPAGQDDSGHMVIELGYNGDLSMRLMPDKRGVQFFDGNGLPVYRYSHLAAWDANGRALKSQITLADSGLSIQVDVQDAEFPVTVDPLFETESRLVASNGSSENRFGFSVAVDGEWMAIGAIYAEDGAVNSAGAVYMFRRTSGQWTQFLPAFDDGILHGNSSASAFFGHDVALQYNSVSGSPMLVVGAIGESLNAGAAYVYEFGQFCFEIDTGNYDCWDQKARLTGSGAGGADRFGKSVAIDSGTIVIGAYSDEGPSPAGSNTGAVYVYKCETLLFDGDGYCAAWSEQIQLYQPSQYFGWDVAIDDDLIAIGAHSDDAAGSNAGAVFAYRKTQTGDSGFPFFTPIYEWLLEQKITAGTQAGDGLGYSVAVAGDELVAGAYQASNGTANSGVARVYSYSGSWNLDATLLPLQSDNITPDGADLDGFGRSVDFIRGSYPGQDDYIMVGAPANDDAGSNSGSAYLYQRDASNWVQVRKFTANDATASASYGSAVALDATTLCIGAAVDDGQANNAGAAYAYTNPLRGYLDLQLSSNTVETGNSQVTATIKLDIPGVVAPHASLAGQIVYLDIINPLGWPERLV